MRWRQRRRVTRCCLKTHSFVFFKWKLPPEPKEPMHHHRWPSLFLVWDTGGRTGHIKFYHQDGSVHDVQSRETPLKPGSWRVTWLKPEPMHSIENVEMPDSAATVPRKPPTVRALSVYETPTKLLVLNASPISMDGFQPQFSKMASLQDSRP